MQRDADKPRPGPAPEPSERDDVVVAGSRCPFCHDAVKPDGSAWVACAACLARHHAACWDEAGRCGACGHAARLTAEAPAAPRAHSGRAVAATLVGVVVAVLVAGGMWVSSARRAAMSKEVAAQLEAAERARAAREAAAEAAAEARRVEALEAQAARDPGRLQPGLPVLPEGSAPAFADAARQEHQRLIAALGEPGGDTATSRARLAYVLARLGDGEAARVLADRALDQDPLLAAAWLARAQARLTLRDLDRADDDLRRAERLTPDAPDLWLLRGEVAEARGDWRSAAEAYRRALELGPPAALVEQTRRRLAAAELLVR